MAKKSPKKPKPEEIKTEPGAWERFEHAVDAAVKSGPRHRSKIVSPKPHLKTPPRQHKEDVGKGRKSYNGDNPKSH